MDLDGYSRRAEAFTCELAREHYRRFAGLSNRDGSAAVFHRHSALFSQSQIEELRAAAETAGGQEPALRRARALLRFAVEGHITRAVLPLDVELARREAEAWLEPSLAGRVRFREAALVQAAEDDPERREALDSARREVIRDKLTPVAGEALERRWTLARELGWASYRDLYEQTTGVDLRRLGLQAEALLRGGAAEYRATVDKVARRSGADGLAGLRRADLPWLLARGPADAHFAQERLTPTLARTLADMGIDIGAQHGLTVDVADRHGKSPRAFCAAVRVPGEVYLVVPPRGGREDYLALMHEAGHAQHFVGTNARLPFELRRLGDPAVGEAFAFLLEGLVSEPLWLKRHLGIEGDGELAQHAAARRLILLRRYAAKLVYELELYDGHAPTDGPLSAVYAARMEEALAIAWPPDTWLTDVDPGLYVASYLRAWALEAALRRALRDGLGDDWFAQQRAGALLRGMWRQGQRLSADELLEDVAPGAQLDVSALAGPT